MAAAVIVVGGLVATGLLGLGVARWRRGCGPGRVPAEGAAPPLPPAALSGASWNSADGSAAQALQTALHALALAARDSVPGVGNSTRDRALRQAVETALEQRDWSARNLPRRPQLLPQLIQTVNDSDANARAMAAIIGQDPVLTGNLLRIANSPAYRLQARPVTSMQRAVTLVGTDGIRQIISAVLVQPVMQLHCAAFPQFGTVVWEHALLASRAAADHARLVTHEDGFAAQWLGLLQGLGAMLVMRHLLDACAQHEDTVPPPDLAAELLAQWTLPLAGRIAAAWELPPPVHAALLQGSDDAQAGLPASLRFARAAAAASLLCRHGRIGQAQALAMLEQQPGTPPHALQWIWRRLHGRAVETLEADEPADA